MYLNAETGENPLQLLLDFLVADDPAALVFQLVRAAAGSHGCADDCDGLAVNLETKSQFKELLLRGTYTTIFVVTLIYSS